VFSNIFIFIVRRLSDVPGSIKTEEIAWGSSTHLTKKSWRNYKNYSKSHL